MNVKVMIHEADEGGYWAEVPALHSCVSQGETADELLANIREAIDAWFKAEVDAETAQGRVVELAL